MNTVANNMPKIKSYGTVTRLSGISSSTSGITNMLNKQDSINQRKLRRIENLDRETGAVKHQQYKEFETFEHNDA